MQLHSSRTLWFLASLIACLFLLVSTYSFAAASDRITGPIAPGQLTKLSGGVPSKAAQHDQGPVDPSLKLGYMTLLTVPSASQQKAINHLLAQQQNPRSPQYHKWLTPEQYADRFGLSPTDIKKITAWLRSQGFSIRNVARARNFIVFSGTAAQAEMAFQTQIHSFNVDGEKHFANIIPPSIPTALSGVVTGIRGLNNFRAKSNALRSKSNYTFPLGGNDYHFLAPGDITTMYDLQPLYTAGFDGTGQSLAVIGQTDVYLADLSDFRSGFGLPAISCPTNPNGVITSCNTANFQYVVVTGDVDPGSPDSIGDDLPEADIDLEWSAAAAPGAQIVYVNAPDFTGNGVIDSMYFTIDNALAPVMTMSYTIGIYPLFCELGEAESGFLAADEAEFLAANTEGITFLNSSGDSGAAGCDYRTFLPVNGYALGYPSSSPSITGVGGTLIPYPDYTSTYWSPNNGTDGGSVLRYIPEEGWNDAQELGEFCTANPTDGFCNLYGITSWVTAQQAFGVLAGGGGLSNCVNETGGVCATPPNGGFPQPTWQAGLAIPGQTTAVRFSPDVSLLASVYWPGYILCTAANEILGGNDTSSTCAPGGPDGIVNNLTNYGYLFGGTSVASPIFAGIVTVLNQYLGSSGGLGNINPALYSLAATPANGAFHSAVASSPSLAVGSNGVFCSPGTPANQPLALQCPSSGPNAGFLGFDASNFDPTTGYNLVTGLGSVDANNLAIAWAASEGTGFTLANTGSTTQTVLAGQTTPVYTFTATPVGGITFGAAVTFACSFSPTDPTLTNTSCTFTPSSIAAGSAARDVTLSITTVGPNQNAGAPTQRRQHANNHLPWLPLSLPLAGVVMVGFAGRKLSKYSVVASLCLALALAGLLVACGGSSSAPPPPPPISVSVGPGSPSSLFPNNPGPPAWPSQTATFTATVNNDSSGKGVTWTAVTGTIASTGATTATYTAPNIVSGLPARDTITATSVADTTKSGSATETLKPATVPGTYTVTVTATDGSTTQTQDYTLQVN